MPGAVPNKPSFMQPLPGSAARGVVGQWAEAGCVDVAFLPAHFCVRTWSQGVQLFRTVSSHNPRAHPHTTTHKASKKTSKARNHAQAPGAPCGRQGL